MNSLPLPQNVVAGLATKSAKIRALAEVGYPRTEIANFLGIRYQHVRKVLVDAGFSGGLQREGRVARPLTGSTAMPRDKAKATFLLERGFHRLGSWQSLTDNSFELDAKAPAEPGVYVFVVDGSIEYVGLTRNALRARLAGYVYGHAHQRTSARVKQLIILALASGASVEVLIATPPASEWSGLPVNTAAGLEAGLITLLKPQWNIHGAG